MIDIREHVKFNVRHLRTLSGCLDFAWVEFGRLIVPAAGDRDAKGLQIAGAVGELVLAAVPGTGKLEGEKVILRTFNFPPELWDAFVAVVPDKER
jgi:hypothetical protein